MVLSDLDSGRSLHRQKDTMPGSRTQPNELSVQPAMGVVLLARSLTNFPYPGSMRHFNDRRGPRLIRYNTGRCAGRGNGHSIVTRFDLIREE